MGTKPRSHADRGGHARKRVLGCSLRDADDALEDTERIIEALTDNAIPDRLVDHPQITRGV